MRSFRTPVLLAVILGMSAGGFAAEPKKEKKDSDKKKEAAKKSEKDAKKADEKEKAAKEPPKLAFPVPIGHESKGLKLPTFWPGTSTMKMVFNIGTGTRIDEENVNMQDTSVQTYKEDGSPEMDIALPVSAFNLKTRVISTKQRVVITREDFELTGNTMEFNTETRTGTLGGGVKMTIFNLDTESSEGEVAPGEKSALRKVALPPNDAGESIKVTKPKSAPAKETKPSE
ncbi:MAG: LPS export ABC transporter periplasmic protein LptC [Chthoniobacteraceae bacterium]